MEYPIPAITREIATPSKLTDEEQLSRREEQENEENALEREEREKSARDDARLRFVFRRPLHAESRHPIYSSPYAKQISIRAFGRKKPNWYKTLDTSELLLFKEIVNQVEIARQGWFSLQDFVEAFKDFDSTITRSEIVGILDSMEKDEFEELDFGKFLFLLAYKDEVNQQENMDGTTSSKVVTPRQSLILSAIANYVLIASVEDIERFYLQNTRRKSTVLHHHLEATKHQALSEAEMEIKQLNAARHLKRLFDLTGSPYAQPVPFVPRFTKAKIYEEWMKSKNSLPIISPQSTMSKPLIPSSVINKLLQPEIQNTVNQMHYGKIPLPVMKFPEDKVKEMSESCTVEMKDYIMDRASQAKKDMREKLKNAAVLYAKYGLIDILIQGFPTHKDKNKFISVYQKYLPVKECEIKDFSLWVKPSGYEVKRDVRKVHPEKYAFGTKNR